MQNCVESANGRSMRCWKSSRRSISCWWKDSRTQAHPKLEVSARLVGKPLLHPEGRQHRRDRKRSAARRKRHLVVSRDYVEAVADILARESRAARYRYRARAERLMAR